MEFELLDKGIFFETTQYSKYRIPSTGLTVIIFEHDGPIISGNIALKTLTSDNDGLPHTLEHMIFKGSSSYPQGFLDFAANKCLSNGTNAWTDQDHTAYTVSCAGKEGFLSLLPIFLDHILFPLLTEDAFVTEVHHINGEGQDGGVVYCEMQTYENTMDCIADRDFAKTLFGDFSPYAVETGGMLHELRTSCKIEKCRDFHKQAYRAENMNIIICGKLTIEEVVAAITQLHNTILANQAERKEDQSIKAPQEINTICSDVRGFSSIGLKNIPFPSAEDADPGCMLFGFQSWPLDKLKEVLAEDTMLEYLINTSASPLTKNLVHTPEPYCASVTVRRLLFPTMTVVKLKLAETDSGKHDIIKDVVHEILLRVRKGGIDLNRIKSLLENNILQNKFDIEDADFDDITYYAIITSLYGYQYPNLLQLYSSMNEYFNELIDSNEDYWNSVLHRLMDSLVACIAAQPSSELLNSLETEEEERIELRKKELGEEKLAAYGEILSNAEESNDSELSLHLLSAIKKPDLAHFDAYDKNTIYGESDAHPNLFLHAAKSSFYRFYFIVDTDKFSANEKSLILLLLEACCNLPVDDNVGTSLTGDEVASLCEKLFLKHSVSLDLFEEQICFDFTMKEENLEESLNFFQLLLFKQIVDKNRIKEYLQNIMSTIKASKRCGHESIYALVCQHVFPFSACAKTSIFCQEHFLESVSLDDACSNLENMLNELFTSDCCLHIMSNVELLERLDIDGVMSSFKLNSHSVVAEKSNFVTLKSFIRKDLEDLKEEDIVVKVPGEESSYMASIIPISHSLYDPLDIKMRVFTSWFGQLEGVFGKEIRGKGLAYHFYVESSSTNGALIMHLQQSTDISTLFSAVKELMDTIVLSENPVDVVDEHQVELAKSAAFYSVISKVSSSHQAAFWDMKFIHGKVNRPPFRKIAEDLAAVTCQDIVDLCKEYYSKLLAKGESVKIYTIPQNKDV